MLGTRVKKMLYAEVRRGRNQGIRVTPYRFKDGRFGVTKSKGEPYVFLDTEEQVAHYLALGYLLRMGNEQEGHAPGLFSASSIHGWQGARL
jgi:hypothetical protein